ncbi:alpha/beta fold hydrolase [Alteromonadaceae bacterium BrNp21-10]|nr:alpha/beta fold hydrolase [Alteromonadaceae bacterium BrNp21-10]
MQLLHFKQRGQGQPLLLLHGLFGSLDNLGMVARGLAHHYQVISIDLPDHGNSYHSDHFSYNDYAQAVFKLMDHLELPQASILGHSMGGKVAMSMALTQPKRVEKLIVADIAPVAYPPRHEGIFKGLNNVDLASIKNRQDAEESLAEFIYEAGVRQFLLKSLQQTEQSWQWRFNLAMLQRDYAVLSEGITATTSYTKPTLFIKGELSDYLNTQQRPLITSLFTQAEARVMLGCGHWLHAEKPAEFNRIVTHFINA